MIPPPLPSNERQRLATLHSLKILDTPPEERFDRVTRLARQLFDVPIALVSLIDADRQWFKSRQGLDACETPRSISFCGHTILQDQPMIVEDACEDERFRDNPLVTGDPRIRFYAGYPLTAPDGSRLGSLCLIDTKSRTLSEQDLRNLSTLAQIIEAEFVTANLTTTDALTGLSNLRGFLEIGRHVMELAKRFNYTVQLLFLQIERLDDLRRLHGSVEAERALVEVGQVLSASFRNSDLVSRIGDNEFGVLLSRNAAVRNPSLGRLEELLKELNSQRLPERRISVKATIATFSKDRHSSLEDLVTDAEQRIQGSAAAQIAK
jgi:diguanylate cyclase (GGDEF)-like protein